MRKGFLKLLAFVLLAAFLVVPFEAQAVEGTLGYEGGISSENKLKKDEYQYSEMCFLTGKPILLTGTLTIKKTDKNGVVNATYTYRLENPEYNATMNRVLMYTTTRETKINGQVTEKTQLSRVPTEVVNIGGTSYRLTDSSFTRSMLTDPKPAMNYHSGEFTETKTYSIGTASPTSSSNVTVTLSGRLYAYEQYWSTTQTQKINVLVQTDLRDTNNSAQWGGSAEIIISSATRRLIRYADNEPTLISFDGGYVQKQWTESTMDYTARFPEFDKSGKPTDIIKTYTNTQSLATAPEYTRLMVPDIKHLNGYWAEEPISILFGLEIIPGTGSSFNVGKNITRREFVAMLMRALKDIPQDPNVKTVAAPVRRKTSKTPEVSPFKDVQPTDLYYDEIKEAHKRGIIKGDGTANFNPNTLITHADAVKMIVLALGLENLAPYPNTTTPFTDNDNIPAYARNAVTVANALGLVEPDEAGRFNPYDKISNERIANMLYSLVNYMGEEMILDYRDRMMSF